MTDNSKIRHSRTHTPHSASVFIHRIPLRYLFTYLSPVIFFFLLYRKSITRGVLVADSAVIRALADTPRIPLRYLFTFLSPVILFAFSLILSC